jgi:uncharacterized protein
MFDELQKLSHHFLQIKNSTYKRFLLQNTDFINKMSLITGQRGVGKTTSLVQILLNKVDGDIFDKRILYIQTDHFQTASTTLYEIAEKFDILGGKWLAFDEIHKYPNWSKELKSIYDTFPTLQIFCSGSSALEIFKGSHDLSRRAIKYHLPGMSFREYLELTYNINFSKYSLNDICNQHLKIASSITKILNQKNLKIIPTFQQYLKTGYYPFFYELNNEALYNITLEQNIHTTIESDIAAIFPKLTGNSIRKIKNLLSFITETVPFIPNWKKIMNVLEIGDERTLKSYFKHLEDAGLIKAISNASQKFSKLESPEKIYLDNPNQLYAISPSKVINKGTLRETFFISMVSLNHRITLPKKGDFLVNNQTFFEIEEKNKSFEQIKSLQNSYLICDEIEQGIGNKIPLWLFGFLY